MTVPLRQFGAVALTVLGRQLRYRIHRPARASHFRAPACDATPDYGRVVAVQRRDRRNVAKHQAVADLFAQAVQDIRSDE
ncbi:hypothetical protein SALBM311S_03126 [Streptomyces alboniger]